ncbi:immunity repressor [Gordonia phage Schmidt]|uniref:Immunity repressor n=1 Tax=Gordonia phage Schmidt TaxID=2301697 RepID=A0A385E091_9CAUD|nr:transcriptional repressor [Gordonia phage Schmidt]AXQ65156.1 immunity repressor [Gordonia phage Schmidt]
MLEQKTVKTYVRDCIGRTPSREELAIAIDASVSTIDRRRGEGFSLDETLAILDYFNLSRTAALLAFDVLDLRDVMVQMGADGALVDTTSTVELARELVRRLSNDGDASDEVVRSPNDAPESQAHQFRKGLV